MMRRHHTIAMKIKLVACALILSTLFVASSSNFALDLLVNASSLALEKAISSFSKKNTENSYSDVVFDNKVVCKIQFGYTIEYEHLDYAFVIGDSIHNLYILYGKKNPKNFTDYLSYYQSEFLNAWYKYDYYNNYMVPIDYMPSGILSDDFIYSEPVPLNSYEGEKLYPEQYMESKYDWWDISQRKNTDLYYKYVDLNNDGMTDVVTALGNYYLNGTATATNITFLMNQGNEKYEYISTFEVWLTHSYNVFKKLLILSHKTNDLPDMLYFEFNKNNNIVISLLKFNGYNYMETNRSESRYNARSSSGKNL